MTNKSNLHEMTHFDSSGTLIKPGMLGRLLRASMGLLCICLVWHLITGTSVADLQSPAWWLPAALGLVLVPYVVNIGFGISLGAWPRYLSVVLLVLAAAYSSLSTDTMFGMPLWGVVTTWMIVIYGHLGISFVLATLLATPGCEMRAIPQLLGMASGKQAAEHYCPAFIDKIDHWEHQRNNGEIVGRGAR